MDMTIDGVDISTYGGASLLDYVIGQTPMTNDIYQGVNDSQWIPVFSEFGLREIHVTILFAGETLHDAKVNRSRFNLAVHDTCELYIPDDGFYYRVSCMDLGDEELVGIGDTMAEVKSRYHFRGIRHDPLETLTVESAANFICKSTAPFTACRVTAEIPSGAQFFTIKHGSQVVAFSDFASAGTGYDAVLDGLTHTVKYASNNWLNKTSWQLSDSPFIYLTPGTNKLIVSPASPVTVEYYPTYI